MKEIGTYVALEHWVSVLLQRQGEGYPWTVLHPDARLSTASTLVSLPGYQSFIALDSGLHLTLWGNLPEFSAWPPVFESVVMLNAPSPNVDLDFTLDRGRVLIASRKTSGEAARVRVRFLREIWELELGDATSEVGLELWARLRSATPDLGPQPAVACVGLFTKGRVRVRTPGQPFDLDDRSRLSWVSREPGTCYRENRELPAWWANPPDRTSPAVQKALRSLLDWSDQPGGSSRNPADGKALVNREPVLTKIKTQVEELKDPDNQDVGVFFLAALNELEPLVDLLKYRQNSNVRGVTLLALQSWLSRGNQHADELRRTLERRGDSKEKAERVVRLLHFLPPKPSTSEKPTRSWPGSWTTTTSSCATWPSGISTSWESADGFRRRRRRLITTPPGNARSAGRRSSNGENSSLKAECPWCRSGEDLWREQHHPACPRRLRRPGHGAAGNALSTQRAVTPSSSRWPTSFPSGSARAAHRAAIQREGRCTGRPPIGLQFSPALKDPGGLVRNWARKSLATKVRTPRLL
jgi:hypothetical protein